MYFYKRTALIFYFLFLNFVIAGAGGCDDENVTNSDNNNDENNNGDTETERVYYETDRLVMGADLSYVNQILDHGGTYRDSGKVENPYRIFKEYGTNVVRVRLWHNPVWVQEEVYENEEVPLYSGLADVTETIRKAKEQGMEVNLDLHYSDTWADPETQQIPEAWSEITELEVLKDSVYNYTQRVLQHLNTENLMPEMVQVGNETNCGMMYSNAPSGFPNLNICEGSNWNNLGQVINSGIEAVRDVESNSDVDTKIILHIAQPENVEWWINSVIGQGGVNDFEIIGFSYYTSWSDVAMRNISDQVESFRSTFNKEVMIMETAYPWTMQNADSYGNIFGDDALIEGFPATVEGQRSYMIQLTQEVINGGGNGVFYWEPAWITSDMKDLWGTGSSWDNNTLFNFDGEVHESMSFFTHPYVFD